MNLADKITQAAADKRLDRFTRSMCGDAAREIATAQRFLVDEDAHLATRDVLLSKPTALLQALAWARPPFERVWIEWPTPNHPDPTNKIRVRPTRVGAFVETVPESKGAAFTFWTAWTYDVNENAMRWAEVANPRFAADLAAMDRTGIGVSASEVAADFENLDAPVKRFKEWMEPKPQTLEDLRAARDDMHNNIHYALADEKQREAINLIQARLRWRRRSDKISMAQLEIAVGMGRDGAHNPAPFFQAL